MKVFDAALNKLIDERPGEWAGYFGGRVGIPPGPAEVMDTDLATTMQADKVYRINGPSPAILHLEFEGASFLGLPTKLYKYHALLSEHDGPPVHTVLIQLRPKAESSDRTGVYERERADGRPNVWFEYDVIRLWEESFDAMLAAGPSLAPLAILSDEVAGDVEPAFARIAAQLRRPEVPPELAANLAEATYNLGGLRFGWDVLSDIYGRLQMEDIMQHSSTYQHTLAVGRAQGELNAARQIIVRQGRRRFGEPSAEVRASLDAITALDRLNELADRVHEVGSWDELLAE
jgi:hypothetical protein